MTVEEFKKFLIEHQHVCMLQTNFYNCTIIKPGLMHLANNVHMSLSACHSVTILTTWLLIISVESR